MGRQVVPALAAIPALLAACVLPRPIEPAPVARPVLARPAAPPGVAATWRGHGLSWQGREIELRTVGSGRRTVLWIGGIHGNEREGSVATEQLPAAFAEVAGLGELVTLILIRDLNPDGSAQRSRGNARGVDLNRNFPASNFRPSRDRGLRPIDQPESRLLHDLVLRERPDLVIVCHSSRRDFINFDGPAEHLARRFSELSGYPVVVSDALHSTPGSLGSWVGLDLGIPILTLEFHRGKDPAQAWEETRDAILAVVEAGP